jgi:hypothetical protein
MIFLPKPPADRRGPQFEKHWLAGYSVYWETTEISLIEGSAGHKYQSPLLYTVLTDMGQEN